VVSFPASRSNSTSTAEINTGNDIIVSSIISDVGGWQARIARWYQVLIHVPIEFEQMEHLKAPTETPATPIPAGSVKRTQVIGALKFHRSLRECEMLALFLEISRVIWPAFEHDRTSLYNSQPQQATFFSD